MEELNRNLDGTDRSHALAAGFKPRSSSQSRRSGGHGGGIGGGRGKRDGRGRPPNQWQPQRQPRHQREQPAHQQRHQQYQRQEPQQQYQRYQARHQPQQPAQHSGERYPSRVCFRCDQHGNFLSECRAVPPTRFPDPYTDTQTATYSYSGDYADFGSESPPSQLAPAPGFVWNACFVRVVRELFHRPGHPSAICTTKRVACIECKRCRECYCIWWLLTQCIHSAAGQRRG